MTESKRKSLKLEKYFRDCWDFLPPDIKIMASEISFCLSNKMSSSTMHAISE